MRELQAPPSLETISQDELIQIWQLLTDINSANIVEKINNEYSHWEEVRRKEFSSQFSNRLIWFSAKMKRITNRKMLPLLDRKGTGFSYTINEEALKIIHDIDRMGGGTLFVEKEDNNESLTNIRNRMLISSLMDEAISTSQIEGAVTTHQEGKKMLQEGRKPKNRSERMILNSYNTIKMLSSRTAEKLSLEFLKEIQAEITKETLDNPEDGGRFRNKKDKIVIVDNRDNQVIYTPPPAEDLPKRIKALIDFVNTESDEVFIHPLIKAGVIHFWLAYEHPFVDGNGRTARALFYWYMLKKEYWLFEFMPISHYINKSKMQYYRSFLYSENDDNDLTYSILYLLSSTKKAIIDLRQKISRKKEEINQSRQFLRHLTWANERQLVLINHAVTHPGEIYTIEVHKTNNNITYETARTDLLELVDKGYFEKRTSGKKFQFFAKDELFKKIIGRKKKGILQTSLP